MRKIFNKTVLVLVGFLSVIGISVSTSNVLAFTEQVSFAKYDSINETTPLYLFHGTDLVSSEGAGMQAHYSHRSHQSHSSHSSHTSHYSSRW